MVVVMQTTRRRVGTIKCNYSYFPCQQGIN